ncbi:flagellar protein FlaG [Azonexus sp.]|uniref:flagellar protein FlaG n=1 Tax=Azonexus sp. TaxID=1872668 RepID=UPI0035AF0AC9
MNINPISMPTMPSPVAGNLVVQDGRQSFAAQAGGSATPQAIQPTGQPQASREELEKATKEMNDFVQTINSSIEFSVDKDTGSTVVKVIDTATKDVLRQIPSEEMLAIARAIDKVKGLLVHQKA